MKTRNLGRWDIGIRLVMGVVALAFGWHIAFELNNVYGLLLGPIGMILMLTALARWCPIYFIIGLSSCPLHQSDEAVF